jgi:hypothetical protein
MNSEILLLVIASVDNLNTVFILLVLVCLLEIGTTFCCRCQFNPFQSGRRVDIDFHWLNYFEIGRTEWVNVNSKCTNLVHWKKFLITHS